MAPITCTAAVAVSEPSSLPEMALTEEAISSMVMTSAIEIPRSVASLLATTLPLSWRSVVLVAATFRNESPPATPSPADAWA